MEIQILSDEKINNIVGLAEQRYYEGTINMEVEQALMVMLSITHYFKFAMDYQMEWYSKHESRMNNEVERFKAEQGIKDWWEEMEWIKRNGALQYHICIQDLLLETLYTLNGLYYKTSDRDYDWEEEFDKIFVGMTYGRDFDIAMLDFLLLPLYNCTHGTNYVMQDCKPIENNEITNE